MEKIKQRMMLFDFGMAMKRWVLYVILSLVISGGICGIAMHKQINEAVAFCRQEAITEAERKSAQDGTDQTKKDDHKEEEHKSDERDKEEPDLENVISEPGIFGKAAIGLSVFLLGIGALAFWLLIAALLYQTANLSGMSGTMWFWMGLAGNLIALIVFFIARSVIRRKCSYCGHWQKPAYYCSNCGQKMIGICPECGAETDGVYCSECGAKQDQGKKENKKEDNGVCNS